MCGCKWWAAKIQTSRGAGRGEVGPGAYSPEEMSGTWIALECISRVFIVEKDNIE